MRFLFLGSEDALAELHLLYSLLAAALERVAGTDHLPVDVLDLLHQFALPSSVLLPGVCFLHRQDGALHPVLKYALGSAGGFDDYLGGFGSGGSGFVHFDFAGSLEVLFVGLLVADGGGAGGLLGGFVVVCSLVFYGCVAADGHSALAMFGVHHDGARFSVDLLQVAEVELKVFVFLFRVALLAGVAVLVSILQVFYFYLHGGNLKVVGAVAGDVFQIFESAIELAFLR